MHVPLMNVVATFFCMNFIMASLATRIICHSEVLGSIPTSLIAGISKQEFDPYLKICSSIPRGSLNLSISAFSARG